MAYLCRGFLAGLMVFAAGMTCAADPVAFVSDTRGDVVLDGIGRPPLLAELLPGSRLVLGNGAGAAVMYVVSGEEFSLKGPGEFVVTVDGVKAERGAPPTRRTAVSRISATVMVNTSKAATASLRMRGAPLSSNAGRRGPVYPVDARIATLQPTFRWNGQPDAVYLVIVTSKEGKEVFRGNAKGPSLSLPSHLAAGQSYSWSYAGASRGESRFETLPTDAIGVAEKARSGAKTFGDRVILALVLQDLGATQDSKEVWAKLAAERPDLPELAGLAK